MTNQDLSYYQGEIAKILRAWHMSEMHAVVLSGELLTEIVQPALRAERSRIEGEIQKISQTKTETLGEVELLDRVLLSIG